MRFLSPLALVGLAMIAFPIAIHLLVRRHAKRLDFPSLKFLRETPSFRLRPRRIQQPLLLALRVAAFVLLVVGIASPLISFTTRAPRMRVILLDASLSMRTPGRSEAAREQARGLINNLAAGERVAIIAFANESLLLSPMTSDKRSLSEAVDRYQPANGSADYSAGFRAATNLLKVESDGETLIDLISDFQVSGLAGDGSAQLVDSSMARLKLINHQVGAELERNAFLRDEEVTTLSASEVSVSELLVVGDERSATRRNWMLDSRDGSRSDIEWRTEPNGQVTARMISLTADDFDPDDSKFIAFGLQRKGRALLIGRDADDEASYLRAAFEATASELSEKRFVVESKASLPTNISEINSYSLITLTLHGKPRLDEMRVLRDYVSAGGIVWLCMASDVDATEWNQFAATDEGRFLPFARVERKDYKMQAMGFGSVDAGAPALRAMNEHVLTALQGVRMRQGFGVTPRDESITLIRWNDNTPAFIGAEFGSGSVLLLATSPARAAGNFGTSAAFPALASSITRLSIEPNDPLSREIGQPVNLGLAPNTVVTVVDAKGKASTVQARDLITTPAIYFPDPGIYLVKSESEAKYLAINTPTAESENALAPATMIEQIFKVPAATTDARNRGWVESTERSGSAWRYLLLTAFLLLIAELFIAIMQNERSRMKTEG